MSIEPDFTPGRAKPAAQDRPSVHVCCLAELDRHAAAIGPARLVSLVPDFEQPATPPGMAPEHHLRLEIDDIVEPMPGLILPRIEHVEALIGFYRRWDGRAPLLIHCAKGKSRSMAAALIAMATKSALPEDELARSLRRAAPHATPNPRIVALADEILQREGRLAAALDVMGEAQEIESGPLVALSLACSGRGDSPSGT